MSKTFPIEVIFTDEDSEKILEVVNSAGASSVRLTSERGLTGIEEVIGAVIVVTALTNIVIRLAPLFKCGTTIDARGQPLTTTKNCSLPSGTIVVIAKDGTNSQLYNPSEVEISNLLERALR